MTSSCENTKAAWQVLRFITYSSEGNLARLSMYDETNTGKYATINKLYYPTTTNPKVAEKFNSLPGVTEVDKYLFKNIDKCRRIDVEKIVPQYNDIIKNYFDEAQKMCIRDRCMRWHFRHIIMEDIFILRRILSGQNIKILKLKIIPRCIIQMIRDGYQSVKISNMILNTEKRKKIIQYGHGFIKNYNLVQWKGETDEKK